MALTRLRVWAYLRSYVAIAPTTVGLIILAILYGGGVTRPEEAYGVSAVVLFPVIAWQVKILLDAEPDVQRRLARVGAGAHREIGAGLVAGAAAAVPTVLLGLALPWLFQGVGAVRLSGQPAPVGLSEALAIGVWTHALAVVPAVALGAWASRAITRTAGVAVAVLGSGSVLAIVLGLSFSPVPWLVPPLMATARTASTGVSTLAALGLAAWALGWAAVVTCGYWRLRLRRV